MIMEVSERTVLVAMPESMVGSLLQMNASLNAGLAVTLQNLIAGSTKQSAEQTISPEAKACVLPMVGKYSAEFLGVKLTAGTLPDIFAKIVDLTALVAPEALDRLAMMRANKRRFVARNRDAIHPGRPDLDVMSTSSGWWISKNIGRKDLQRALRALAQAAGLNFGSDLKLFL